MSTWAAALLVLAAERPYKLRATHSLAHYSLTTSLTHSLTHVRTHLLTFLPTYLPTCLLTQNVAFKLLGVRCPDFAHRDLTSWWDRGLHASLASTRVGAGGAGSAGGGRAERDGGVVRVLGHYLQRLQLTLQVADALGLLVELVLCTPPSPLPPLAAPCHTV